MKWADLRHQHMLAQDWLRNDMLPVASGPGGDLFCLSLKRSGTETGKVCFVRLGSRKLVHLADSFQSFMLDLRIADSQVAESATLPAPMAAIEVGDTDRLKSLLENGTQVNGKHGNGETLLMRAAWRCRLEAIDILMAHAASIDGNDDDGQTALCYAVATQSPSCVAKLVRQFHADVNAVDMHGRSVLMLAVPTLSVRTNQMLVEIGADKNYVSPSGETAATCFPSVPTEVKVLLD